MAFHHCAFATPAFSLASRTFTSLDHRRKIPVQIARLPRRTRASLAPEGTAAVVEIGCGTDLHGQDVTVAAVRACRNAIEFNSLPGLSRLLPNGDFSKMTVYVRLGVPAPFVKRVDEKRVRDQFPYGKVVVDVVAGGLTCGSGVVLPEQGDAKGDDTALIVVAAVSVYC